MEKLRRTRVIVATSEKLTVWYANQSSPVAENVEKISVECPYCGKHAFSFQIEQKGGSEVDITVLAEYLKKQGEHHV